MSLDLQRLQKTCCNSVVWEAFLGKQINQVPHPIYNSQSDLASQAWEVAVYSLDDVTVIGELVISQGFGSLRTPGGGP